MKICIKINIFHCHFSIKKQLILINCHKLIIFIISCLPTDFIQVLAYWPHTDLVQIFRLCVTDFLVQYIATLLHSMEWRLVLTKTELWLKITSFFLNSRCLLLIKTMEINKENVVQAVVIMDTFNNNFSPINKTKPMVSVMYV